MADNNLPTKILFYYMIAAILFMAAIMVFGIGCSPAKKIERKDETALQRVLAKNDLLNKAYIEAAKNKPCKDTITKYVKGKQDTTYLSEIDLGIEAEKLPDTVAKHIADSMRKVFAADYQEGLKQAAKAGYDEAESKWQRKWKKIKIPAPRVDTFYKDDGRVIDAWRTEAGIYKLENENLKGQLKAKNEADKGKIKIPWWLLIILSLSLFGGGFITSKLSK